MKRCGRRRRDQAARGVASKISISESTSSADAASSPSRTRTPVSGPDAEADCRFNSGAGAPGAPAPCLLHRQGSAPLRPAAVPVEDDRDRARDFPVDQDARRRIRPQQPQEEAATHAAFSRGSASAARSASPETAASIEHLLPATTSRRCGPETRSSGAVSTSSMICKGPRRPSHPKKPLTLRVALGAAARPAPRDPRRRGREARGRRVDFRDPLSRLRDPTKLVGRDVQQEGEQRQPDPRDGGRRPAWLRQRDNRRARPA